MPTRKKTSRTGARVQPISKANKLTVAIICALLALVGIFLVYQSFAVSVGVPLR